MNILHQAHHRYTDCKPTIAAVCTAFLFAALCAVILFAMYVFAPSGMEGLR